MPALPESPPDVSPQFLVRLDRGDAAVVEMSGPCTADGLRRLAAVVRRTQRLAGRVVVDITGTDPDPSATELIIGLSHGRNGCAPFGVRGTLHRTGGL
jgi:hypothetical protein